MTFFVIDGSTYQPFTSRETGWSGSFFVIDGSIRQPFTYRKVGRSESFNPPT